MRTAGKTTDPVNELKDEIKFSSSSERFTHLNDVLVLETAQQPQLTQCRVTHVLVIYTSHEYTLCSTSTMIDVYKNSSDNTPVQQIND